jgi:hypothetical protein
LQQAVQSHHLVVINTTPLLAQELLQYLRMRQWHGYL